MGVGHLFGRLNEFLIQRRRRGAVAITVTLGMLTFLAGKLVDASVDVGMGGQHIAKFYAIAIPFGLLLSGLLVYLAYNRSEIWKQRSALPEPARTDGENLNIVPINSLELLRDVQERLVPGIFGDVTPANDEVYRMHHRNPNRSIGLYCKNEDRLVGFASCWPLTRTAADETKQGTLAEMHLRAEHILAAEEIEQAEVLLIVGIGVVNADTFAGRRRGIKLMLGLRAFIYQNYLAQGRPSIEILAVAGSDKGEAWCKRMGMTYMRPVPQGNGTFRPLYGADFTIAKLLGCEPDCE
ncbi:hypothetical protein [Sphingomonas sp.]